MSLLSVENLRKRFGKYDVLSGISFSVAEREVLGLIGPNGAGKTTLLECMVGLQPSSAGGLAWEGPTRDPRDVMFYLPDELSAYAELYAADVLGLFGDIYEVEGAQFEEIVDRLALKRYFGIRTAELSRGTRRRLQLGLALMSRQPLLVLDEPFNALDLHQIHAVMSLLRDIRDRGRTLLLAIHQLTDAERICDRFLLLAGGRLVGTGTLEELRGQAGLPSGTLEEVYLALT